jgi:hypothetical protein
MTTENSSLSSWSYRLKDWCRLKPFGKQFGAILRCKRTS